MGLALHVARSAPVVLALGASAPALHRTLTPGKALALHGLPSSSAMAVDLAVRGYLRIRVEAEGHLGTLRDWVESSGKVVS